MTLEPKLIATVNHQVEKHADEIVQTLQEIIRIPSVVGSEGKAQDYMFKIYQSMGLETTKFEADPEEISKLPGYIEVPWGYNDRPNVIGRLAGDLKAKSLILNGHIDVVSPEPIDAWTYDPWGSEIVEGRLYGRGAVDMKGGLIASALALKILLKSGLKPTGEVMLQSAIEEEAGGAGGSLAIFNKGYTANAVIMPEPQSKMTLAHAGVTYFRVKVKGKTSHAGTAHLGVNAVAKLNKVFDAIVDLDEKRGRELHYPLFEKGSGRSCHINIGKYTAGDWPSTVAGWAAMECRMSFIPGETMAEIRELVARTVMEAAQNDPWLSEHPPEIEWFGWQCNPWEQDLKDPFIQMFKSNAETILAREVEIIGKAAGLDTRFAAAYGMPSFTFGPEGKNLHGIDEYVEIQSVIDCTKIMALSILDWCGYQA